MAINRNEYRFGTLLTALSILVVGFIIAFFVHKTVPVVSYDEDEIECDSSCCGQDGDEDCHHMDDEDEYEEDVD